MSRLVWLDDYDHEVIRDTEVSTNEAIMVDLMDKVEELIPNWCTDKDEIEEARVECREMFESIVKDVLNANKTAFVRHRNLEGYEWKFLYVHVPLNREGLSDVSL